MKAILSLSFCSFKNLFSSSTKVSFFHREPYTDGSVLISISNEYLSSIMSKSVIHGFKESMSSWHKTAAVTEVLLLLPQDVAQW